MIDISKLKTFVAVAEIGSFSKASEILYVTQPAVTQQIKALEKIIGAKLFQRQGGKIVLTEEGKRIYQIAKSLLNSYENLMEEMAKIKKDVRDTLFLGVSTSLGEYKIPQLVAEFHAQMPSINIKLFVENSQQVEEALSSGVLNLGVIEREPSEKFSFIKWLADEIIFFTHPNHPFAKRGEIEPEELYEVDLVFRESSSGTRKIVKDSLEKLGIMFDRLNIKIETNCSRSALCIVKSGYGASFLSKGLLEKEIERGTVVPVKIKGFEAKRWYYIIYLEGGKSSFLANRFIKFLLSKKTLEELNV
ncbi:LysR family transcriptional regulator [Thermocrinis minervae]|uniref:DNA-binding transcriptional regulator, LysR family n=1 Tax=Thermocrinis minervae TaxID=381751 RepID=A0A1M6QTA1_9AQUI|nr:LysR family transcriptional regulator [Thermocrinis minervae]SHK23481.1 DNA-binding transcriptional regulator, LysR family [Thermocrinis minervae]